MIEIVPLHAIPDSAIEALLDRAFGPGRHLRTAYAIRGDGSAISTLSFAATADGVLAGSVQCWPIELVTADARVPLVMVGPVAVEPGHQGDGIGRRLMLQALSAADATGAGDAMMLIGDPEYYGRFFGFTADHTTSWQVPGPVERHRLLARGNAVPDLPGMLAPRARVSA